MNVKQTLAVSSSIFLLGAIFLSSVSFAQGERDAALSAKMDALISKVKALRTEQDSILDGQEEIRQEIGQLKIWVNKKR